MSKIEAKGKRILFLGDTLSIGGAERSIINLLPGLIALGYECEVACLMPPYTLAPEIEAFGVKVHRLRMRTHRWNFIEGTYRVIKLLRQNQFDFIFSIVYFAPNYAALSRIFSRKTCHVVSFQGLEFERDEINTPWMWFRKIWRTLLMKYFTDGIVAASRPIVKHYAENIGRNDIEVVPNSVSALAFENVPAESRTSLRAKYSFSENDFVLISPARFIPEKGHEYLARAIKLLKEKGLEPKALFFGFGEQENYLKKLVVDLDLTRNIFFHPALPPKELFSMIQSVELFVLASTSEGFGLAIAEASALGAPVVATQVGGILDVVRSGETGILVPSRDPSSLANAIEKLMNNSELRIRLGNAGRVWSKEQFNGEVVAQKMDIFLQNCLRRTFKPSLQLQPS